MDREESSLRDCGVVSTRLPNTTSNLVNGDMIDTIVVVIPEAAALGPAGRDEELSEGTATALSSSREETVSTVNLETRESSTAKNSSFGVASETVLVIDLDEAASAAADDDRDSLVKNHGLGLGKESEKTDTKIAEAKNCSAMINMKQKGGKGFNEDWNRERVCRICHLASDQSPEAKTRTSVSELIQLGCDCKDDLGVAHSHCAEAWFKLKGNRMCEICGETAKNVEGIGDSSFMEEWNEGRAGDININASNSGGCWRGQPFCNLLMACLVIAFVLPWFFRINIF